MNSAFMTRDKAAAVPLLFNQLGYEVDRLASVLHADQKEIVRVLRQAQRQGLLNRAPACFDNVVHTDFIRRDNSRAHQPFSSFDDDPKGAA